jgi:hypothetical protein
MKRPGQEQHENESTCNDRSDMKYNQPYHNGNAVRKAHSQVISSVCNTAGCETNQTLADIQSMKKAFHDQASSLGGLEGLGSNHGLLQDRLVSTEKRVGDAFERHAVDHEALKKAYAKHSTWFDDMKGFSPDHHASLEKRVVYIEKVVGDSAILRRKNSTCVGMLDLDANDLQVTMIDAIYKHDVDLEARERENRHVIDWLQDELRDHHLGALR